MSQFPTFYVGEDYQGKPAVMRDGVVQQPDLCVKLLKALRRHDEQPTWWRASAERLADQLENAMKIAEYPNES